MRWSRLVVTGTWLLFFHILGSSWSQLTFIFFRGAETTNQLWWWIDHGWFKTEVPSGNLTTSCWTYGHLSWENSLPPWSFSIDMLVITGGYPENSRVSHHIPLDTPGKLEILTTAFQIGWSPACNRGLTISNGGMSMASLSWGATNWFSQANVSCIFLVACFWPHRQQERSCYDVLVTSQICQCLKWPTTTLRLLFSESPNIFSI